MKLFGRKDKSADKSPVAKAVQPAAKQPEPEIVKPTTEPAAKSGLILARASVLVKPLVSEKATMVNALNKYVFIVSPQANKSEIKKAIKELYGVMPVSVNIINKMGKFTFSRGRLGKTKDFKKAIITLKKGDSIKIYEGI